MTSQRQDSGSSKDVEWPKDGGERARELLSQVPAPRPLSDVEKSRMWAHVREGATPRRRVPLRALGLAIGIAAPAALAAAGIWGRLFDGAPAAVSTVSPPVRTETLPPVEPPLPAPEAPPVVPPSPPARRAAPAPATPAPVDQLHEESRLVATALRQLRVERNAPAALQTLEAHRTRYPSGTLTMEAKMARVEALVGMGNSTGALNVLDELAKAGWQGVPRADELRVARAELLSQRSRCAEALAGLEEVAQPSGLLRERVLYGRAACLAKLGRIEESRSGLKAYLAEFPSGKFAGSAKTALGESR